MKDETNEVNVEDPDTWIPVIFLSGFMMFVGLFIPPKGAITIIMGFFFIVSIFCWHYCKKCGKVKE